MKYVREHINEKFTQDSDPIKDIGIGIKQKINEIQNRYKADNYGVRGNYTDLIDYYMDEYSGNFEEKEAVIDYLLTYAKDKQEAYGNFLSSIFWRVKSESEMLKYFDFANKKNIISTNDDYYISIALRKKLFNVAQFFLDIGFNININNDKLISDAFVENSNKAIDWLLKRGAKLNPKNRNYRIFKAAIRNADEKQITMCAKAYLGIK